MAEKQSILEYLRSLVDKCKVTRYPRNQFMGVLWSHASGSTAVASHRKEWCDANGRQGMQIESVSLTLQC